MTRITVHATPRASRDELVGWRGAELQVRITAAPEGGKANAAIEKAVAEALRVPKSTVRVVKGHTSRVKVLEIDADEGHVKAVLGGPDPGLF